MAAPDSTALKRCSKKEQCVHPEAKDGWLPATDEYFKPDNRRKGGLRSRCRKCQSEIDKRYHDDHKEQARAYYQRLSVEQREKRRQYGRDYYAKNTNNILDYQHGYSAAHPEKRKEQRNRSRFNNRDKAREAVRQWSQKYPEKRAVSERNRRARKHAAEGTHTATEISQQYKRQKGKCYYCGCQLTKEYGKPNSATVDHVVPLSRGGSNDLSNLVIACADCNSSKQDKLPHEWSKGGRLL